MGLTRGGWTSLAALLIVTGACSDDDDAPSSSSPTTASATSDAATTTTAGSTTVAATATPSSTIAVSSTAPPTTAAAAPAFEVPHERLRQIEKAGLTFEPVQYPRQPGGVPWSTERWPRRELRGRLDAEVDRIVERAFGELSNDTGKIDAIVAVQGGELVLDEYNDWDPDEPHVSWSMAKSITQSMVGRLVQQGRLDIWAPLDAPEWRRPGDPRGEITLDMLLRMSSGLEWTEDYADAEGDVLRMLYGDKKGDRAHYVASKPLADQPDTVWYYSTGTSNVVARAVADEVGLGKKMVRWADRELFAKIGISGVRHDLDGTGLINGGSVIDMKPRDFARFGLLYLRDGVWDGEQLLPEGWVDYSRMPTPTAETGIYGAQWWIDDGDGPGEHGDLGVVAFSAQGFNGQTITVVPELDLVVVVLSAAGDGRDNEVRQALLEAFVRAA